MCFLVSFTKKKFSDFQFAYQADKDLQKWVYVEAKKDFYRRNSVLKDKDIFDSDPDASDSRVRYPVRLLTLISPSAGFQFLAKVCVLSTG